MTCPYSSSGVTPVGTRPYSGLNDAPSFVPMPGAVTNPCAAHGDETKHRADLTMMMTFAQQARITSLSQKECASQMPTLRFHEILLRAGQDGLSLFRRQSHGIGGQLCIDRCKWTGALSDRSSTSRASMISFMESSSSNWRRNHSALAPVSPRFGPLSCSLRFSTARFQTPAREV